MRTLQDASASWQELKQYSTIAELEEAVRIDGGHFSPAAAAGLRSVCWKAFLLFDSVDAVTWPKTLASARSAYDSLRMHFLRHLENPDDMEGGQDPLSADSESTSPAAQLHKDEELRAEIQQDVDRCMPENLYFRQPETQRMLLDILFVFCKLNPDVGYRQGMHELLAPILWVVERDAIDLGPSSKALGEDVVVRAVFDAEYIEHDTFALFSQVMHSAKNFYEQTTHQATDNPMVVRSKRIFSDLLPQVDPELATHLEDIEILPQVFLMRWIRLLFGREFAFDDTLALWDVIFAEDNALEIVDYICLAMLLRIRWQLLDADYNSALTLLLRYPEPAREHPAQCFALDALYLREHFDLEGSGYIVLKYSGRPLMPRKGAVTPPALQRNITAFSGIPTAAVTSKPPRPVASRTSSSRPRNFEALLQSTARNIYARGERLGTGLRSAVDEVHKRAQEIRETPTPSSLQARARTGPGALYARVKALEQRNRHLAVLLEGAVSQLWEYQKAVSADGSLAVANRHNEKQQDNDNTTTLQATEYSTDVEKLSLAIARVQFVQVYLDDPSLPLPETDDQEHQHDQDAHTAAPNVESSRDGEREAVAHRGEGMETEKNDVPSDSVHDPHTAHIGRNSSRDELADASKFVVEDDEDRDDSARQEPDAMATPPRPLTPKIENNVKASPQAVAGSALKKDMPSAPLTEGASLHASPLPRRPPIAESPYSWMLSKDSTGSAKEEVRSPTPRQARQRPQRGKGFLFGDAHEGGGDPLA
ncbi:hypothetical protein BAUCODRAFT_173922 [Baudoinia panamericana UAMH 10762]|uniref:Rab-GAP TBC domain-containing protein n=1 Tax=Baudoinia panamericana (strain UAMH 10762) TaxID=717646 RepID=M2N8U6_BAUPA|nr:uncharacterized protein BAUCODRAFT_173922 [Baudoinia panamericana UAMH 10762]EMD00564.1 hypothetical protein BAUCODRAFT_173922 [Baudoinia panamericana UAMH 10762]